ncbi:MAG: glucose dehydrogenase [Salinisphaeraceae bacterium]|nr:glucose dehydrogenase [Salinisphaeraceae bacterium]
MDPGAPQVSLTRLFSNAAFSSITDIQSQPYPGAASASGDRLFVVQQGGQIWVVDNDAGGNATPSLFLDISDRVTNSGEQGLLGLAFHPDFENNGHFYVHYVVDSAGISQRIRIVRYTVPDQANAPNTASAASEQDVLMVDQAAEGPPATNHNGGTVAFSPLNGYLHISVGDGGSANDPNGNGQNTGTLSGSVLRIDVDATGQGSYGIPADNPLRGVTGARGEVFAYGLRNPFKISFDMNGDLWIADVGQSAFEEVNFLAGGDTRGPNYGWDCREGSQAGAGPDMACASLQRSDFTDPVYEYGLPGSQSITGGYVYRGSVIPALLGLYIYGDFVGGQVWAYDPVSGNNQQLLDSSLNISTFGRGAAGELFVADYSGEIYRLDPTDE